jgi:hypothetical protein
MNAAMIKEIVLHDNVGMQVVTQFCIRVFTLNPIDVALVDLHVIVLG